VHCHSKFEKIIREKTPTESTVKTDRAPNEVELTKTEWSPGYRECRKCDKFTAGPRSKTCVHCHTPFEVKVENDEVVDVEAETEKVFEKRLRYPQGYAYPDGILRIRNIPNAEPPVKLKSATPGRVFPSDKEIKDWCVDVRQRWLKSNKEFLSNGALYFWARNQINGDFKFQSNGDEMQYLQMVINGLPDAEEVIVEV
jgi:hypothetical protein